ncbi:MAG: DUF1573 domain-containing protein [Prevotellaceae bacterium]|jgi:hypothetical protein|nr:DUF1573 domain-containing protein [Prevotellaceae bacterium]
MNKMIKTLGSLAILLFVFSANAQKLEFDELVHDFGTIKEELGSVTHAFKFTNTGDKPLVIARVQASCGCTTPGWTKEPVKPGETGEVLATYRTSAGPFDKTLTVTATGLPNVVLHIKGNVTKKPEDLKTTYPQTFGDLRAKNKRDFSFPQISSKQTTTTQTVEVANAGEEVVNVTFENVPEYITVNAVPASLNPRQKGQITVSVNGEKRKKFGYSKDQITVKAGNANEVFNVTSIVAEKIEKSDTLKFPVISITQPVIDLGKLTENKASGAIEIKNLGNADLLIKSFSTDNKTFTAILKKELKIKAGKTGTIKLSASNLQKGSNTTQIYFSTNDPLKSLVSVTVKAELE